VLHCLKKINFLFHFLKRARSIMSTAYRKAVPWQLDRGVLRHRHLEVFTVPANTIQTRYSCWTAQQTTWQMQHSFYIRVLNTLGNSQLTTDKQ